MPSPKAPTPSMSLPVLVSALDAPRTSRALASSAVDNPSFNCEPPAASSPAPLAIFSPTIRMPSVCSCMDVAPSVSLVPQLRSKPSCKAGRCVVIALGQNHGDPAATRINARHRIGAEVLRNDDRKGQTSKPDRLSGRLGVNHGTESEACRLNQTRRQLRPHIDNATLVVDTGVKIDNGYRQGIGLGVGVPYAGEVNQRINRRHRSNGKNGKTQSRKPPKQQEVSFGNT